MFGVDSLAYCLSKYVNNKYTPGGQMRRLREARVNGARYFTIAKNVSFEKKNQISKFPIFNRGRHGGGLIVVDNFLSGTDGQRLTLRVSEKTRIPINESAEIQPEDGSNVRTTLDIGMQEVAENALMSALKHHDAQSGSAIVMDVNTGQVKALANLEKTKGGYWETFNYGVGTNIEPGSVLYQGLDKEGKIKAKQLIRRFEQFNITYPTGVEIVGEPEPHIKDPEGGIKEWSGLTLPWMSIGYEMQMTPLQILAFYNAVANDGKYMKPYLVSEIFNKDCAQKKFEPTVLNQSIASEGTIERAQELLAEVVRTGTARKLKSPKYDFSGKTGTAQINYNVRNKRSRKKVGYRSSFVGYFPSKQPKYSCIVIITDPKQNGIYGADVAGPVFREIMDNVFYLKPGLHQALNNYKKPKLENKDLPSSFAGNLEDMKLVLNTLKVPYIVDSKEEMMTTSIVRNDSIFLIDRPKGENLIPNVVGMGVRDALYVLENEGVQVKLKGKGKVKKQSIRPGTRIAGQTIHLTLG